MTAADNRGKSETVGFWREDHVEGCYAAMTNKECDCPPARFFVPLDAVTAALRGRALRPECRRHDLDDAADFIEGEFGAKP